MREIYEMCQLGGWQSQVCDIFRDSASSLGPSQTFVNPAVKLNLDIFIRGERHPPKYVKRYAFQQGSETFQQETKLPGTPFTHPQTRNDDFQQQKSQKKETILKEKKKLLNYIKKEKQNHKRDKLHTDIIKKEQN